MKRSIPLVVLALVALFGRTSDAAVIFYEAVLTPEAIGATGNGSVDVIYDDVAHTLLIQSEWSGLSGPTTVAHVHCCTAAPGTGTVGVAVTPTTLPGFPAGVMAGTYTTIPALDLTLASTYTSGFVTNFGGGTIAGAEAALIDGFDAGRAYFNIHSSNFPGGEIRGFLQAVPSVPEPTSLGLLGMGVGVAALAARKRRQRRRA